MSGQDESVVRRFYEEMCNGRRLDLAEELFTADHVLHDPQIPAPPGPAGVAATISAYQQGVEGHWQIEEIFSTGDRVTVRWTGTGTHVAEMNGLAPTGRSIRVDALSVHRMREGKIAETYEVWDTLGFLQQLGAAPGAASALLRSGYEAFARQDIPAVLALFDDNINWYAPDTVRFGGTYQGPAHVVEFFSHLPELYSELSVEPERYIEQGDTVAVLGTNRGRTLANTPFEIPFVHVWQVVNGKAIAFHEHFDTARVNAVLGIPAQIDVSDRRGVGAGGPPQRTAR